MKNFFNYIFSLTFLQLFLIGLGLSIFLAGSFFYLVIEHSSLIIKDSSEEFKFSNLTFLGIFYVFSGIIPNFLFIVLIIKILRFLFIACLKLISGILGFIFSDDNLKLFNEYVADVEDAFIKNKPKINKAINKIKFKKKIKKDYLMPLSIIISATIIAFAIFFQ